MVKGHHLQLMCHPPLFHNFRWFNMKAHPIIQDEVNELLANGAIEPATSGSSFNSNIFAVSKHAGGLQPILNLEQFNYYMHTPISRCLLSELSDRCNIIFNGVIILLLLIARMPTYIFLLLSIAITFVHFVWQHKPYLWKVWTFWLAMVPRIFNSLTKPILFLCCHKGFLLLFI